jgi:iron complex transport system ATP-binding protein
MTVVAKLEGASLGARVIELDLEVDAGACVVLVGPNGAGKSTALQLLAGSVAPSAGSATLAGRNAAQLPETQRAGLVAWLPQRPNVEGLLTGAEVVALARFRHAERPAESLRQAEQFLATVQARHLMNARIDAMSGGEVQRVLLAALRAQQAPLLLVDEPANHLDPLAQVQTYRALGELWQKEHATLCLVTHDLRLCRLLGPPDRILVVGFAGGRIVWRFPLGATELTQALAELYGVPFAPFNTPGGLGIAVDALEGGTS